MQPENLPVFEIDLGNETDANQPRARLLNWNSVNYADVYADQTGERSKITKIVLHYNNGTNDSINGTAACESFLTQFQTKMGYSFQSFLGTAIPHAQASGSGAGSGGMRPRT